MIEKSVYAIVVNPEGRYLIVKPSAGKISGFYQEGMRSRMKPK
jgi:hypothetical protein